jgi:hypothetical protein
VPCDFWNLEEAKGGGGGGLMPGGFWNLAEETHGRPNDERPNQTMLLIPENAAKQLNRR